MLDVNYFRLNNRDPHVIILALSLLDSCWGNCGQAFRKEVSSNGFINELMAKAQHVSLTLQFCFSMFIEVYILFKIFL